ncbi:imidazole glycerol phosphate synthase subunit HisH [Symbiobacterium thermophilum]|uniref:Imidazole glycerol phosphate synthase subunit HisH n=1 Tax=Symbiobacterium thermophilum (strain DSM 24528 / JCM 14929 / IAM 14863 / T) TaxID=292459 RepID=HIS5_SYMTH|nr:imidazole glycerol phosphate synthase subunit HisH [Symbiobacterium thermophilum]Q67KH8.1 RecName: Full=Imidazole glycerol phosphate synthase subunit HisH; AltName: Full=IGP synthase glutaminase subunit; AltName: Full=IGP synthase subunit HisH; AltName: Full=ImGP synthase subunit HisH; Short=IGPS subunit HisH [Symbiobacterium thermophilum IAM 14863]BAD41820.1 imidazole glycerol phosphate synthase subunit [Symbiobacterium thermophilum IAM 14863]
MARIVIVDYGMGNLASVRNALRAVGFEAAVSDDPAAVAGADGLVLPGVGAFGTGMQNLARRGLDQAVRQAAAAGRPVLGICLGMQLLLAEGDEGGPRPGLGLLEGRVARLPDGLPLPQIGWNLVEPQRDHPLFAGLPTPFWAYFDHAYAVEGEPPSTALALTDYGRTYPSVVGRGNLLGIQFHPEKSSRAGLRMLANWGRMVCDLISTRPST